MKFKEYIKKYFKFNNWEKIGESNNSKNVPSWVMKAFEKQEIKLWKRGKLSYDRKFYVKGKHFLYKMVVLSDVQGGSYHFYKRLRKMIEI